VDRKPLLSAFMGIMDSHFIERTETVIVVSFLAGNPNTRHPTGRFTGPLGNNDPQSAAVVDRHPVGRFTWPQSTHINRIIKVDRDLRPA